MVGREVMSTYVAAKAVPYDRIPPTIAIPHFILVKCGYIATVRRHLSNGFETGSGPASQGQCIICGDVNHVSLDEMFGMNEQSVVGPFCVAVVRLKCGPGRWSRQGDRRCCGPHRGIRG